MTSFLDRPVPALHVRSETESPPLPPHPLFCTWPKVVCIMCLSAQWEAAGQLALALAPGHQCVPSLSLCHHIQFI